MFTYQIQAGTTNVSVVIRIIDSTDGTPETGVVFNTSGLDLEYRREGSASVDITEATLAALTTAHSDGGFLHIGNGYYRLDLPDAACASGVDGVLVHGTCTGMVVIGCYIQLVAYDPFDSVRMGMTALPNAAADAAGGLVVSDAGGLDIDTMFSNIGDILTDTSTTLDDLVDDLESRLGTPSDLGSGATIAANLVDIEGQTDDIGVAGAGLTAVPWNPAWDAQVESEVDDALVALGLDHLLSTSVAGADIADNSIIAQLVSSSATADWDTYDNTSDSLQAIRDRGDSAWITATGFSTLSQADIRSAVGMAAADLDTQLGTLATAASISALNDFDPTSDTVNVGSILGTAITETTGGNLAGNFSTLFDNGNAAATLTLDGIALESSVDALPNSAEINAEMVDALATDTYSESAGAPPATASLAASLTWLKTLSRNELQSTSSLLTLRNDADSADIATAALSDNGTTFIRGEFS